MYSSQLGVGDRGQHVHHRLVEEMRRELDAPRLGGGGDLAQLGEAAAHRVGLQDRYRVRRLEERPQVLPGEVALAAHDARLERGGDPLVAREVSAITGSSSQ